MVYLQCPRFGRVLASCLRFGGFLGVPFVELLSGSDASLTPSLTLPVRLRLWLPVSKGKALQDCSGLSLEVGGGKQSGQLIASSPMQRENMRFALVMKVLYLDFSFLGDLTESIGN